MHGFKKVYLINGARIKFTSSVARIKSDLSHRIVKSHYSNDKSATLCLRIQRDHPQTYIAN